MTIVRLTRGAEARVENVNAPPASYTVERVKRWRRPAVVAGTKGKTAAATERVCAFESLMRLSLLRLYTLRLTLTPSSRIRPPSPPDNPRP